MNFADGLKITTAKRSAAGWLAIVVNTRRCGLLCRMLRWLRRLFVSDGLTARSSGCPMAVWCNGCRPDALKAIGLNRTLTAVLNLKPVG